MKPTVSAGCPADSSRRMSGLICGFCALAALVGSSMQARADDWPQFRGIEMRGWSAETHLARTWPVAGPKVLWTAAVGTGYGGPAVRDGEVFLLDRDEEQGQDVLRCLGLADGREKWRFAYKERGRFSYPGSRGVPTVTAEHVYMIGAAGRIHCVSRQTHRPVWSANVVEDFRDRRLPRKLQTQVPRWGLTQHPVLWKDWLIVAPYALEAGVVALDRLTGKVRWRSGDVGMNIFCHATPRLATLGGVEQAVVLANRDSGQNPPAVISGVELATGRVLWQTETTRPYNIPIPMPVQAGDDRLFIAGGYGLGCFMLRVAPGRDGGGPWRTELLWQDAAMCTPHVHTPVLYKGRLYANSFDQFHNACNNGLVCLTTDGRLLWRTGGPGAGADAPNKDGVTFDSGGFLIADDLVFMVHGRTGELYLIDIGGKEPWRIAARAKVLTAKGRKVWGPPALADGRLLVRDLDEMKCLDVSGR